MDRFGPVWFNHREKLRRHWLARIKRRDIVLLLGDISWAMTLEQAHDDFAYLHALPGQKIIIQGNHDFWWTSRAKMERVLPSTLTPLFNDPLIVGRTAIVGYRGWDHPQLLGTEHAQKIWDRETQRLAASLITLKQSGRTYKRLVIATHHKPMANDNKPTAMVDLMAAAGATHCLYGHIHLPDAAAVFNRRLRGVQFVCLAADLINMFPQRILIDL